MFERRKEKAEIDVRSSKDSIQELEIKVKQLKDDEIKTRKNLHNIRQSLSEKRTAYAETTERSRPIKYILSLKDKKEIGGVLGRCVCRFVYFYFFYIKLIKIIYGTL